MKAKREATWLQHREETTNAAQHPGQEGLKEWESWPFLAIRLKYVLWLAKIAHSSLNHSSDQVTLDKLTMMFAMINSPGRKLK